MTPKLIVVSGSSGAGKSSVLRLLEDEGYYCVDNLPPRLLPELLREISDNSEYERFRGIVVCVDARTVGFEPEVPSAEQLLSFPDGMIIFLDAQPHVC